MMITVFTPTYNRANTLPKLYDSLCRQSVDNFEWVVVDDGSSDDTGELFDLWMSKTSKFNINYVRVENGGKHRAVNHGLELAKYDLFFIVDSDDYLCDDALEKVLNWVGTLETEQLFSYAGVSGLKGYSSTRSVGKMPNCSYIDATALQRKEKGIKGDKAEVYFTNVLRRFKFPEFSDETFMTESIVWNRLAREGYFIRWFNEIIYICNYLEGGLTNSGRDIFLNNPRGYALSINENIKDYKSWSIYPLYMRCKFVRELKGRKKYNEMSSLLKVSTPYLVFIYFMFDWVFKLRDYIKRVVNNASVEN